MTPSISFVQVQMSFVLQHDYMDIDVSPHRNKQAPQSELNNGTTQSSISSVKYVEADMMCCANNIEGTECSQLYDYGN